MSERASFSVASGKSISANNISGETISSKRIVQKTISGEISSTKSISPHLRHVENPSAPSQFSAKPLSGLTFDTPKNNLDSSQVSQPIIPISQQQHHNTQETSTQTFAKKSVVSSSKAPKNSKRQNIITSFAVPRFAPSKEQFHSELTANITIWLYQQLKSLGDHRKYVEVEYSLGRIDKKTDIESVHAPEGFVLNPKTYPKFHNKISTENMKSIHSNSDRLIASRKNEFLGSSKVHQVDEFFKLPGVSDRIRKSTNNINKTEILVKKPVDYLIVVLPNSTGFCKIKISLELPLSECTDNIKWENDLQKLNFTRNKDRENLEFEDFVVSFTQVDIDMTEVEVEMNQTKLLELFQRCKRKDPKRGDKITKWLALEELITSSISAVNLLSENSVF